MNGFAHLLWLRKPGFALAIGVWLLCGFVPDSFALKNVVILPFSGPRAEKGRKALIKAISSQINLIPHTTYREVAASIGVSGATSRGVKAVCRRLACHAVISGKVTKVGRKYQLKIVVKNGRNGRVIGTASHVVRGRRLLHRAGFSVSAESLALIERTTSAASASRRRSKRRARTRRTYEPRVARPAPAASAPEVQLEEEASAEVSDPMVYETQPGDPVVTESPPRRSDAVQPEVVEPTELQPAELEPAEIVERIEEEAAPRSPLEATGKPQIFALAVGVGMARRDYRLEGNSAAETSRYRGSVYPEVTVSGEIFPFAPWINNAMASFGIEGSFTHHLSISTELPNVGDVDTSTMELRGGLFYDFDLPGWGGRTQIRARAGLGSRSFDLGENNVLPSFDYKYLQIGAEAGIPLGSQYIGVMVGGDARPILAVGQEAVDAYGSPGSKFGWSVGAGLFGALDLADRHQLRYFTRLELALFGADFKGLAADGIPSRSVQEFPDRQEATSGTDQFVRLWAGIAYAY